jgi:dTDP-4-dehydrorhamnose reductase
MKILITGASGQLGSDCQAVLGQSHELAALPEASLDITDPQAVDAAIRAHRPDWVVNCAAYTQVDRAETERDRALAVNASGPRYLAEALSRHGGWLLHVSTDYVFGGLKPPPTPYLEDDPTGPLSQYGLSKLRGEEAIREATDRFAIVRTAWLYGRRGPNFLKTMLRLARRTPPQPLKVVHDQFGSLTWSHRLARQIARLVEAGGQGIYHATAEGVCTWYEAAQAFLGLMGVDVPLAPITTAEYPTPAVRPKNSILENRRLKEAGLNVMRPWQEDLEAFVRLYREELLAEATPGG